MYKSEFVDITKNGKVLANNILIRVFQDGKVIKGLELNVVNNDPLEIEEVCAISGRGSIPLVIAREPYNKHAGTESSKGLAIVVTPDLDQYDVSPDEFDKLTLEVKAKIKE